MKKEDIDRLRADYPHWWDPKLALLPDGWTHLLDQLFCSCDMLNDGETEPLVWVSLRLERFQDCELQVYATPAMPRDRWTKEQAYFLVHVLDGINQELSMTCEVCGLLNGYFHKTHLGAGGRNRILCEEHGKEWSAEIEDGQAHG